jgi:hypothetical protein
MIFCFWFNFHIFSFEQRIIWISKISEGEYFWGSFEAATRREKRNSSGETQKDNEQAAKQTKYDLNYMYL